MRKLGSISHALCVAAVASPLTKGDMNWSLLRFMSPLLWPFGSLSEARMRCLASNGQIIFPNGLSSTNIMMMKSSADRIGLLNWNQIGKRSRINFIGYLNAVLLLQIPVNGTEFDRKLNVMELKD